MFTRIGLVIPIGLVVASLACKAEAPTAPAPPPMIEPQERPGATAWGGLSWGASANEVMALYPSTSSTGIHNLDVGGMRFSAFPAYEKGRLIEVTLEPIPPGCDHFGRLGELLGSRYGAALTGGGQQRMSWHTNSSFIILLCGRDGQLHLVYQDRAVATRRLRAQEAATEARNREAAKGL